MEIRLEERRKSGAFRRKVRLRLVTTRTIILPTIQRANSCRNVGVPFSYTPNKQIIRYLEYT